MEKGCLGGQRNLSCLLIHIILGEISLLSVCREMWGQRWQLGCLLWVPAVRDAALKTPIPVLHWTQARGSAQPPFAVFLLLTCLDTPTWLLSSHKASWLLTWLESRKVCPQADRYKCARVLGPLVCRSVQECAVGPRKEQLIQLWTWKVLLYFPQVKGMQ